MQYTQPPQAEPVVVCMGRALVAFEHSGGNVIWHFVAEAAIRSLTSLVADGRLSGSEHGVP